MAVFFTRKSHAAAYVARNYLIGSRYPYISDIFDSHHPLHPATTSGFSRAPLLDEDAVWRAAQHHAAQALDVIVAEKSVLIDDNGVA
jgi:hypothetical protein